VLAEAEAEATEKEYRQMVQETLADRPRSGSPGKFSAEQLCQIIAVACQPPAETGRPFSHWTAQELADEVVKQKIVASISPRHIGRFLKGVGFEAASVTILADE
jgi:transposase